jgi:YbgC/YbaW family acyl-CoA thioester hydrolase
MAYEFKVTRRVEFSDTDLAGIMHFAHFFRFMETAEHRFFRSLGFSIVTASTDPPVGWPRVHAACDYRQPLHFEDEVEVHLLVREMHRKALAYAFRFFRVEPGPRMEVAQGSLTVVCVSRQPDGRMKATAIPKPIADRIEVAPHAMLAEVQVPRLRRVESDPSR